MVVVGGEGELIGMFLLYKKKLWSWNAVVDIKLLATKGNRMRVQILGYVTSGNRGKKDKLRIFINIWEVFKMIRTGRKNIKVRWKVERNFSIFFFPTNDKFFFVSSRHWQNSGEWPSWRWYQENKIISRCSKGEKIFCKIWNVFINMSFYFLAKMCNFCVIQASGNEYLVSTNYAGFICCIFFEIFAIQ